MNVQYDMSAVRSWTIATMLVISGVLLAPMTAAARHDAAPQVQGLLTRSPQRFPSAVGGSSRLALSPEAAKALLNAQGEVVIRGFPLAGGRSADFTVQRFEVFTPGAKVIETDGTTQREFDPPAMAFFEGPAVGDDTQQLVISIADDRRMWALVRTRGGVDTAIGPMETASAPGAHELVEGAALEPPDRPFCSDTIGRSDELAAVLPRGATTRSNGQLLEIEVMVDVGNDLYVNRFNQRTDAAVMYVGRLFAKVAAVYRRDLQIAVRVSQLFVWSAPEPFAAPDKEHQLERYACYNRPDPNPNPPDDCEIGTDPARAGYVRDVAHYLSLFPHDGGLAMAAGALCNAFAYSVSNIDGDANLSLAGYIWDVKVVAHEIGHNAGSIHTHCFDPPLDHCHNQEATCYAGPVEPQVGEAMSYCHTIRHCADDNSLCTTAADCAPNVQCMPGVIQIGFTAPVVDLIRAYVEPKACVGKVPVCGDRTVDAGEACDDGNTVDGDCCSANCGIALPCKVRSIGTSKIKVYQTVPSGRRIAHAAKVRFAPSPRSPVMDWFRDKTKVRLFYRTARYACVEGITAENRLVHGWVRKSQIKQQKLVAKLPVPPDDPAKRICDHGRGDDRSVCGQGCDADRPDARPGAFACGPAEPDVNPCYTTTLCTVRQSTNLLYDPNRPTDVVHTIRKARYCTGNVHHSCVDDSDCSGELCRDVGSARWSRVRLGAGRRIGLGTGFTGSGRRTVTTSGGDYVWVAAYPPRSPYSEVISGWARRQDLCCSGDAAVDDDPACSAPPSPPHADAATATNPGVAAPCTIECCGGGGATLTADDQQDCIERADEADVCERGQCDVSRLQFDGADVFTRACQECCALCKKRTAFHLVDGGCDDCATAAEDYCAVGTRGKLETSGQYSPGTCIDDPAFPCHVDCCDGSSIEFPSSSKNECLADGVGSDACGSDECAEAQTVTFNGHVLFEGACSACVEYPPCYELFSWGGYGFGDGQFAGPRSIAVDGGNVYVGESAHSRIQKFDLNGSFITKWGTYGSGNGQLDNPQSLAVNGAGNVYVIDSHSGFGFENTRVQAFTSMGGFITKWGSYGTGVGQFNFPEGIGIDGAGSVYVADSNRVQKFDAGGGFLTTWGSYGNGDGQFLNPSSLVVDPSGYVYVSDDAAVANPRIQKFDGAGTFTTKWPGAGALAVDGSSNIYVVKDSLVRKYDGSGTALAVCELPGMTGRAVAVDAEGFVYVVDDAASSVRKLASP